MRHFVAVQADTGSFPVGAAEIDLRARTGASVRAIRRGEKYTTSPAADERISAGDVLYLLGDESDIALARHQLAGAEGYRPS